MKDNFKIVNAGNFLDFLEFSLFSCLLPLITRDLISASNSSEKASLAYLLFFMGFIGRPLGALIFGYLGDTLGRRKAMVLSLKGMSCATLLLAFIPSFQYAYLIIAVARFLQGIFTGGEYANATVYVYENVPSIKRFRNVANLTAAGVFGASLGQIIGMLISSELIPYLNWRLIFILISMTSLYVAIMRTYHISEIIPPKSTMKYKYIKDFLYSRYVFLGIIFGGIMNGLFYLIYTFMATYGSILEGKFISNTYFNSLLSSLMMGGFLIFWSRLKILERYTSTQFIKFSLLMMVFLLYPIYTEILGGKINSYSTTLMVLFISFMMLFTLMTLKSIPENLPKQYRVLLSGLPETIGASFLGGSAPYVSSQLINHTNNQNAPALYFIGMMIFAFILVSLWPLKDTRKTV